MSVRRPPLLPLAAIYGLAVACKNRAYDLAPQRAKRLAWPAISVGSLSAGGAGKTPFLIALGRFIESHLHSEVDVLSRGYGRTSHDTLAVDPGGSSEQFGDEPLLIARTLACPVFVAAERATAGQMAEQAAPDASRIHLLDDGFQHRRLHRDIDIVLLTAEDANDTLLPAGNLREPLRSMRRASILVLRAEEREGLEPVLRRIFRERPLPPVWTIQRTVRFTSESARPQHPFAFCGLARPRSFRDSLAQLGMAAAGFAAFRDHHRYTSADMEQLARRAQQAGADGFVTTAKDAVRLSPEALSLLSATGPLAVADMHVAIENEPECATDLARLLAMRPAASSRNGAQL